MDLADAIARQPGATLYVEYLPDTGRIILSGAMPREDLQMTLIHTKRKLLIGDARPETHYVDFSAGAPVLTVRPELDRSFDKSAIAVREPATLADLPAATITFVGPVKGHHEHPGGDFVVGWTVPGAYTVTVEAFPYLPAAFTLTVGGAS